MNDVEAAYEAPQIVERAGVVAPLVAVTSGAQNSAVFRTF